MFIVQPENLRYLKSKKSYYTKSTVMTLSKRGGAGNMMGRGIDFKKTNKYIDDWIDLQKASGN